MIQKTSHSFSQKDLENKIKVSKILEDFSQSSIIKNNFSNAHNVITEIEKYTNFDLKLTEKLCQTIIKNNTIAPDNYQEIIEILWQDIEKEKLSNDIETEDLSKDIETDSLPNVGTILVNPNNNRKYKIKKIFTKQI